MFRTLVLFTAAAAIAAPQGGHSGSTGLSSAEISAKIVLEDGSPLTAPPLIVIESTYGCPSEAFLDGTLRMRVPYANTAHTAPGCVISVRLKGYQLFKGWVEDGTVIKLNRTGPHEGDLISSASLRIPPEAKKRYQAAEALAAKQKWPQAEEQYRAAIALAPEYAIAWSELGRSIEAQDRIAEAVDAYDNARKVDPSYVKPVIQLAEAAGRQGRWADEMSFSQQALKMNPSGSANLYYYLAQAAFHVATLQDSEKLVREAIRQDRDGSCPEAMALMGQIFEKQGNVPDAAVEYKAYLKAAPHGTEAQSVREALARLKRPN